MKLIGYLSILFLFLILAATGNAAVTLVVDDTTITADDGDGAIEPNECIDLNITLRNDGADGATGSPISATLSSNTGGVTTPSSNETQSYSNIAELGGTSTNAVPFRVSVSPVFACGVPINLTLTVTTDQGVFQVPVQLATGSVPPQTTTVSDGTVNKNIKDGRGQVNANLNVTGVTTIVKVTASVHVTHNRDSDLEFTLTGPDGTSVDLSSGNGGTGTDYGTSCGAPTTFDDDAATSITAGTAPFSGSFQPESPLSAFIGKTGAAANGNWKLRVRDRVKGNPNGSANKVICWSLTVTYAGVCSDGGVCAGSEPVLLFSSVAAADENNIADVNDCFDLNVGIRNDGTSDATGISNTTLTTSTPGVFILQNSSAYGTVTPGSTVVNSTAFQIQTSPAIECGSLIDFTLSGTSTEGGAFSIPVQLRVGDEQDALTATGPVNIPDGDSNGAELQLNVSGITGTVGSAIVDVYVEHTSTPDLTLQLIGPDNTTINLSSGNGGATEPNDDYGFDCTDQTRFDDGASIPIASGSAPFELSYIPEEALSAFAGKDPNGVWKLRVIDNTTNTEVGTIECWSLTLITCVDGDCCPDITVEGTPAIALVGQAYTHTFTASGSTNTPFTFTTNSALPDGLTLESDGDLVGTPTEAGVFNITITATDTHGCSGSQAFVLTVDCTAVSIDTTNPANGTAGQAYNHTFTASGSANTPYSFATGDSLPAGLTLESDGDLTGTPTETGTFNFTVTATDTVGCTDSNFFSLTIVCPTITLDDTLPNGTESTPYSGTIIASGGDFPYTYAVTAGSLPTGLTLNTNGTLSGTPTVFNTFNFTVTATDENGCTGSRSYEVVIARACIFCDDFEDGDFTSPLWTVVKDNWSVVAGNLVGTTTKKAEIESPAFTCTVCTWETTVRMDAGAQVSLYAWYTKNNDSVELRIYQNKQKIMLKQRKGTVNIKGKVSPFTLTPGVTYNFKVDFDGTNFHVRVDNVLIPELTIGNIGQPAGKAKLRVKSGGANLTGRFGFLNVHP